MSRPLSLRSQGHRRGGHPWNTPHGGTVTCPCLFSWMTGPPITPCSSHHTWPTVHPVSHSGQHAPTLPEILKVSVMGSERDGVCGSYS